MKKRNIIIITGLCLSLTILGGCSNANKYSDEEKDLLNKYDVYEEATSSSCKNTDTVKYMLNGTFEKENISSYCSLPITDEEEENVTSDAINALIDGGLDSDTIEEFISKDNFHSDKASRYAAYKDKDDVEDIIWDVNLDLDEEPYESTVIQNDDSNMAILVNKFNALPEGYAPDDLVEMTSNTCVQGEDYSCQTVDTMYLRKEAYDAYIKWCKAAKKQGIKIRAIAAYRTYEYQYNLWSYNASITSVEEADKYYARAGQSEHNSGLAVDITFNSHQYNLIENYGDDGYDWILENAHKYGFILRYPEDKVDITRYGYESWHFRYVGEDIATECYDNDWCLEEYYAAH